MYPEFIAIYIGLAVLFIMLAAVLILLIVLLRQNGGVSQKQNNVPAPKEMTEKSSGTVVFCKNCATQFDSAQHTCPKCGTPR